MRNKGRSQESEDRNQESGVRSQESEVRSQETGVRSQESEEKRKDRHRGTAADLRGADDNQEIKTPNIPL